MPSVSPKDIIAAIPTAHTVTLPERWFETLPDDVSVWTALYNWLVETRHVDSKNLHNRTYAAAGTMKRLLAAERRRIARQSKLRGKDLERAVSFSDLGSGPQTVFAGNPILGNCLIVLPEKDNEVQKAMSEMLRLKIKKANDKIRNLASGADFGQWLISNSGRDDRIGDLAQDVIDDRGFPGSAKHYQEALEYLRRSGACDGALESLAEAWNEYAEKYPDRIVPSAWCAECEGQICEFGEGMLALTEFGDVDVFHTACLSETSESEIGLEDILSNDTDMDSLNAFFEESGVSSFIASEIEARLRLWGFRTRAVRRQAKIYFIQVGTSGPIKIGYNRGRPEQRLASLQTGQAEPLRLLAEVDGDRSTEAELHRRFANFRLSGEWFDPNPEIIQFIAVLRPAERIS